MPIKNMKTNTHHLLSVAAVAVMIGFFSNTTVLAQGNFDPAQFRQRALENYRERIEVKSDADWEKLEPLVTKVMDAQRDARAGIGGGFFGGGGRGNRGGGGGGGDQAGNGNGNRNRFGAPSPETD